MFLTHLQRSRVILINGCNFNVAFSSETNNKADNLEYLRNIQRKWNLVSSKRSSFKRDSSLLKIKNGAKVLGIRLPGSKNVLGHIVDVKDFSKELDNLFSSNLHRKYIARACCLAINNIAMPLVCSNETKLDLAEKIYSSMQLNRIEVNHAHHGALVKINTLFGGPPDIIDYHASMASRLNKETDPLLMMAHLRIKIRDDEPMDNIYAFIEHIHHTHPAYIDDILYRKLLYGLAERGRYSESFEVMIKMLELYNLKPSSTALCALLRIFCSGYHHASRIADVWDMILYFKVNINEKNYTSVISACVSSGLVTKAKQYFDMLLNDKNLTPNIVHYTIMIEAYAARHDIKTITDLLYQLKSRGLSPNDITFTAILKAFDGMSISQYTENIASCSILSIFDAMLKQKVYPNVYHYTLALHILTNLQQYSDTRILLNRLIADMEHVRLDEKLCFSLLSLGALTGNKTITNFTINSMLRDRVQLSRDTGLQIMQIFQQKGLSHILESNREILGNFHNDQNIINRNMM